MPTSEGTMVGEGTIVAEKGLRLPTEVTMTSRFLYVTDTMQGLILRYHILRESYWNCLDLINQLKWAL